MKKILLLLVLLPILTFSQSWRTKTAAIDSGSYSTDAFNVDEGYILTGIVFPSMTAGTTSYKLLAGLTSTSVDTLWYNKAEFIDSLDVDGSPVSIDPDVTKGWQWFKVLFSTQQTADATLTPILTRIKD